MQMTHISCHIVVVTASQQMMAEGASVDIFEFNCAICVLHLFVHRYALCTSMLVAPPCQFSTGRAAPTVVHLEEHSSRETLQRAAHGFEFWIVFRI
jgi:hypothetical protein